MKWLKAQQRWLKAKLPDTCPLGRKKENEIVKPMKELFPYSYPYESMYPGEKLYSQTSTGEGIHMDPEKGVFSDRQVP